MINRRILRIKAMQASYAYGAELNSELPPAQLALQNSVNNSYKLIFYIYHSAIEVANISTFLEEARQGKL